MRKIIQNKGITLVALVITIVILLILSGITIAQLTGEKGILKHATQVKNETELAQNSENIILKEYEKTINDVSNNYKNITEDEEFEQWVSEEDRADIKNLDEAVKNKNLMEKLMNNNSSVDYMVQSKFIINKVLLSEVAMKELGKSEYASSKVIKNKKILSDVISSNYINSFDDTRKLIPQMTSNKTEQGEASLTGTQYNPAYYAFDRLDTTSWCNSSLGTLLFKFNESKYAYKINLYLKSNAGLTYLINEFKGTIKLLFKENEVYKAENQTIYTDQNFVIQFDTAIEFDTIIFEQKTTISSGRFRLGWINRNASLWM